MSPAHDISCGFEFITTPNLQGCLTEALQNNYSFIVTPLIHPRFTRQHSSSSDKVGGFTRSDMILSPHDWTTRIVGRLSQHWNVDEKSPVVRLKHEDGLSEELGYCKGLALPAIVIPLHGCDSNNLARVLLSYFESSHNPSIIWTRVPMVSQITPMSVETNEETQEDDDPWNETWFWWSKFHERLEWDKRVGVVVELSADLPSQKVIDRWLGEPIKAIVIPTYLFHNNKKGFPVLSRAHQHLVISMVEIEAQVIISGAKRHDIKYYVQYMQRLWMRRPNAGNDAMLQYARGWEDFLQTPLQPLADNLDTHTYNVFEKDPIKYDQYQKAIARALTHFKSKAKKTQKDEQAVQDLISKLEIGQGDNAEVDKKESKTSGDHSKNMTKNKHEKKSKPHEKHGKTPEDKGTNEVASKMEQNHIDQNQASEVGSPDPVTVMVLGAGRGPLVRATFNAADITNTKVKVIVVEKNPCAVVVLAAQVREMWRERDIIVVPGDMRRLNLTPKADIIISELLGSWADNELSPECLDGAAALLKPGGISIPSQYKSYVAPISSARLWAAAKYAGTHSIKEKNLETLWVVYMQNKHTIAEAKPLFTFDHPAKGVLDYEGQEMTDWRGLPLTDNRRQATVTWEVTQDNVVHGFGGYFDCALYGGEMISILPSTHSPGMISWFPIFIPIMKPLRVRAGDKIKATFWRCVDTRKVWYEWLVEVGDRATCIHNTNGRSSEMLL